MGEGVAKKAISGESSGVTRVGRAQGAGSTTVVEAARLDIYRVSTSGLLREDVGLDGDAAGIDEGTAVLVMVKGSWGKTSRPQREGDEA